MQEKRFLVLSRWICLIILLVIILVPLIVLLAYRNEKVEAIGYDAYIEDYDGYFDRTTAYVKVTFDRDVDSAGIEVMFYDGNGSALTKERETFWSYGGNTVSGTFYVNGKAESCKITDIYSVKRDVGTVLLWTSLVWAIGGAIALAIFISSLSLSCKEYRYNGNDILVYAGWYNHYIKVNGEKFDEHNTLTSFTALTMSCTLNDGAVVQVTISIMNSISLKINGRLQKPIKRK